MNYIKENLKEFETCNILLWHSMGYTGKGVKIANMEKACPDSPVFDGKLHDPFNMKYSTIRNEHGNNTAGVIHQIAPDADIYMLSDGFNRNGDIISGKLVEQTIPFIKKTGITLVNASLYGKNIRVINEIYKELKTHGVILVNSAGNEGAKGLTGYAASNVWISVGAVGYNDWGAKSLDTIFLKDYSSRGKELDYTMFSGLFVHDLVENGRVFEVNGTSFSSPMFCGMLALVQQFFLEKAGRVLYQDEIELFIQDHLMDLGEVGWDEEFGHGLFILPHPNEINTNKYVKDTIVKPNNPIEVPENPNEDNHNIQNPIEPTPEKPKEEKPEPIKVPSQPIDTSKVKLIIDAGHGGTDSGASAFGYLEKDLNLVIAKRVKELLKEFKPDITRTTDTTLEPDSRTSIIKDKYDYCISIHLNAGGGDGVEGIHSVFSNNGKKLAEHIVSNIKEITEIPFRTKHVFSRTLPDGRDYYYMHRNTGSTTTVIVECLFLDNAENIKKLNVEGIAQGIANGFKGFIKSLNSVAEPPNVEPPKEEPKQPTKQLTYTRPLTKGTKGDDVKELQMTLKDLGFYKDVIDGSFGNNTDISVRNFQRTYNLAVDGSVGKLTIAKINEVLSGNIKPSIYKKIRRFDSDIHILEIGSDYHVDVDLGQRNKLERVSTIVNNKIKEGKKVVAGINGGFFNFKTSAEHLGMLIDDGLYYTPPTNEFIDFIYYKDGTTEIKNLHGYNGALLSDLQKRAYWAVGTSYSLVQKGKINLENIERHSYANSRNPRTMIGQKRDGTFLLVVADGRSSASKGLTAQQQAELMLELGCYNSSNFDGGGSSCMVLSENGQTRVVNKPSDGAERSVGSVLLVYKK